MHYRDTRGATPVLALPAAIQPRVPQAEGNKFCLKDTLHQVRGIHMWGFGVSGGLQTSEVFLIQTTSHKDFDCESCKQLLLPLEGSEYA